MHKLKSFKDICAKYNAILTASQKRWGVVLLFLTLIGAVFELMGVSIVLPLVQVMIEPQQLRDNASLESIIDFFGLNSNMKLMWGIGASVIVVYIIKNLFLLLLSYIRVKYSCKVRRELSIEMMNSYMERGYVFFLNTGTGEIFRGIQGSIANTYVALNHLLKLVAEVLTVVFICIFIMSADFTMALCIIALAAICLMAVIFGTQKVVRKSGEIAYKYSAFINTILLQTFQGIKEVLVMRRQQYFVNEYKKIYIQYQKGEIKQNVAAESPAYIIEAVCVSGLIIAVCFKAICAEDASMLVPQLASYAVAAFRILPSLGRISNYFNQFMYCIPGINETYINLREARKKDKNINIVEVEKKFFDEGACSFQNKLSIENVTWRYPNTDNNVLEDISLQVYKGQAIAFVGKSGAGKTTLADIILGLLIPQSGEIKIDGINIIDMQERKSKMIGFVPQNVNLLDDTVRRNVAFGIRDEKIDDNLVWKALEQAQMKEIIEESSQGLDTEIGERGIRFSGGQRQRLAIARALYCNPDILILDEATSALDSETEAAVMEAIEMLQGHKTLIIIAHRLTTIKKCEKIYEIVDGKAIERTFEEIAQ